MATICPTVTAFSATEYRTQMQAIQGFARRIHIDFMDGVFAPTVSVSINDAWWQPGPAVDLHVLYQKPLEHVEDLVALKPHMIIIHAEAEGCEEFIHEIDGFGIKKGIALLQDTAVDSISKLLPLIDHVLIFSGNLGHFGGVADLSLLDKVKRLTELKPGIEIGWDGGINEENVKQLIGGGVTVLNVGGHIQRAENPESAYDTLVSEISEG